MENKMLIDAAHPEETRVVVLRGNRVEEFDYESAVKQQLRGNIYLAKVTRVEPSLQAAFVDYGGNRHGFLAFSEIHPDYYQIPVADRQLLLEEEAAEEIRAEAEAAAEDEFGDSDGTAPDNGDVAAEDVGGSAESGGSHGTASLLEPQPKPVTSSSAALLVPDETASEAPSGELDPGQQEDDTKREVVPDNESYSDTPEAHGLVEDHVIEDVGEADEDRFRGRNGHGEVESVGSEDAMEEVPDRVRKRRRVYNIQEVIKRRQIILVQVVKEERGGKGAALTTYLSLAGRYTVLMPNTARGGGISRKITNPADRKRLRKIAAELEVTPGTGLIIRTAGASRTKAEIKRDFEYLLRLWENVRDLTLQSTAPTLVYEEGNLIKRSIRDLYSREIGEVLVAGDDAYREAKDFMRMLMPSHAKNVQPYKETEPLFIRHQIERQLNAMFSPYVTLKSGGYIVINQAEALVAIDVNSGKATREHNIEDTALKTNAEAAEEIARQLRLRDLAGLIVIDFIDMEERRNNRAVERRLKECLRHDRARIQVGRISHFGLLEMSRQRLRTGVLEGSTTQCVYCQGTGVIRSKESIALSVLRALEDTLKTGQAFNLNATASVDAALYILNEKRYYLKDIERRYGIQIFIAADEKMHGTNFKIEKSAASASKPDTEHAVVQMETVFQAGDDEEDAIENEDANKRPRKRRRRKRPQDKLETAADTTKPPLEPQGETQEGADADIRAAGGEAGDDEAAKTRKSRRRGRRGGRRNRPQTARKQSVDRNVGKGDFSENADEGTKTVEETAFFDVNTQTAVPVEDQAEQPTMSDQADSEISKSRGSASNGSGRRSRSHASVRTPRRRPRTDSDRNAKEKEARDDRADGAMDANSESHSVGPPPADEEPVRADDGATGNEQHNRRDNTAQEPRRGWWQRRLEQEQG